MGKRNGRGDSCYACRKAKKMINKRGALVAACSWHCGQDTIFVHGGQDVPKARLYLAFGTFFNPSAIIVFPYFP